MNSELMAQLATEGLRALYRARVTTIPNPNQGQGWDYSLVEILNHEGQKLGEYTRNYGAHGENTFEPFIGLDGNHYALYSSVYTATRLMKLPECTDLGGEAARPDGFCPTGLFVPFHKSDTDQMTFANPGLTYASYGFVCGCVWGDDADWKIQFLDLTQAHKGNLVRDERLGLLCLPGSAANLRNLTEVEWEYKKTPETGAKLVANPNSPRVRLPVLQEFDLSKPLP